MPSPTKGAHPRLARQFYEAELRATPEERDELDRLDRLVRCEALGVFEASGLLTDLIRQQHERERQAA